MGAEVGAVHRFEGLGGPGVEPPLARAAEVFVQRPAQGGVGEAVEGIAAGLAPRLHDHLGPQRLLHDVEQGVLVELGHVLERGEVELAAEYRRQGQHVPAAIGEPGQPVLEQVPNRPGDGQGLDGAAIDHPSRPRRLRPARVEEVADELFEEEGVSFAVPVERLDHARGDLEFVLGQGGEHLARLFPVEGPQDDAVVALLAAELDERLGQGVPGVDPAVLVGADHQEATGVHLAR